MLADDTAHQRADHRATAADRLECSADAAQQGVRDHRLAQTDGQHDGGDRKGVAEQLSDQQAGHPAYRFSGGQRHEQERPAVGQLCDQDRGADSQPP